MIRIFRRIRQSLLAESKFSKYLIYACGEIVLVVIGILIALQVNEWNNERNREKAEVKVLKQLQADLTTSVAQLENIKIFYLERAQASATVLRAFWMNTPPEDSIVDSIFLPASTQIYSPVTGTLRSLINSGNIDKISSDSVKTELTTYLEEVDYKLKDVSRYEETYYRTAKERFENSFPNTIDSLENLKDYFRNNKEAITNGRVHKLNVHTVPFDLEKVPFKSDLNALFQDKNFFLAYKNFLIAHRNIYSKYDEILTITAELTKKIEKDLASK